MDALQARCQGNRSPASPNHNNLDCCRGLLAIGTPAVALGSTSHSDALSLARVRGPAAARWGTSFEGSVSSVSGLLSARPVHAADGPAVPRVNAI